MKFNRNDLAEAVTHAVNGIPNNPVIPVRAGMLIKADGNKVTFTGSDGDVTFTGFCYHDGGDGKTIFPGKLFAEVVKTLPDKDVHIVTDDSMATISCGRVQFKLPLIKEEYPEVPEISTSAGASIDGDLFADAIRKIIPAASKTGSNPALSCVYLEPAGDRLWCVCTDRYRLAAVQVDWYPIDTLGAVLIPFWALERYTRTVEGTVFLGWDDRVATLSGDHQVTSRVWDARFPEHWRTMLPETPPSVEVSTEDLSDALKRAALASEGDSPVQLTFSNRQLRVEAGYGNHADDIIDTSYTGEDFTVLLGIKYLTDGLAGCGPVTRFGWSTPLAPMYLQDGDYTYTVLPRRQL